MENQGTFELNASTKKRSHILITFIIQTDSPLEPCNWKSHFNEICILSKCTDRAKSSALTPGSPSPTNKHRQRNKIGGAVSEAVPLPWEHLFGNFQPTVSYKTDSPLPSTLLYSCVGGHVTERGLRGVGDIKHSTPLKTVSEAFIRSSNKITQQHTLKNNISLNQPEPTHAAKTAATDCIHAGHSIASG